MSLWLHWWQLMLKHERCLVMFRVYVHLRIVFELMLHVLDCVRCGCEPHVSSNIFGQGSKMLHQSGKL